MSQIAIPAGLERYQRQIRFTGWGVAEQEALQRTRVLLVGVGALGTNIAEILVRAGVGRLVLADRDFIELNNLQRQTLLDEEDIAQNLPKAEAAARKLRRINSTVAVEPLVVDVNHTNIEGLVAGADLVLDGTDNFSTRYLINDACVKHNIPWVYGGVLAAYGVTMTIIPGKTPCLRCLFAEMPPPGTMPTCETAGILGPIVRIIASFEAAEAMKLIGGRGTLNPGLITVDVWDNHLEKLPVARQGANCPTCGQRQFDFLQPAGGIRTTSLCGRGAVQVAPPEGKIALGQLAERLRAAGAQVALNEFMLRCTLEGFEFTVFPDARAIIKGTQDETLAKSLYARYIGA